MQMILTAEMKYYTAMTGGIFLLIFFVIWIFCLARTLLSGQESRLQKEYGTEEDIKKDKRQRKSTALLTLSGVILLLCVLGYIFLL